MLAVLASLAVTALPMPGDDEARRFDEAFTRAEALYSRGDYGAAITLFREADRLKVTSEVAYDLARSYEKLGDLAFTTLYDRLSVARAPEAADAPELLERVQRTLNRADDEGLGLLEVFCPVATAIVIDGRVFPLGPAAMFLPAGDHRVEADFAGGPHRVTVKVRAGRVATTFLDPVRTPLLAADVPLPAAVAAVTTPVVVKAQASPRAGAHLAGLIALAVGAAAFSTGLVVGALASADAARATDKTLTVSEASLAAAGSNGKASMANVLFIAGGIVAAGGGLLFVLTLPSPGEPSGEAP